VGRLIGVALLSWFIKSLLARPGPRMAFDRWLLTAPLLGKLVRGYNTVRFASTLAILTAAGVRSCARCKPRARP